jgi:hypothetical protein
LFPLQPLTWGVSVHECLRHCLFHNETFILLNHFFCMCVNSHTILKDAVQYRLGLPYLSTPLYVGVSPHLCAWMSKSTFVLVWGAWEGVFHVV